MFQFVRRTLAVLVNRLWPFSPPENPYAAVREPRRRKPMIEVQPSLSQSQSPLHPCEPLAPWGLEEPTSNRPRASRRLEPPPVVSGERVAALKENTRVVGVAGHP